MENSQLTPSQRDCCECQHEADAHLTRNGDDEEPADFATCVSNEERMLEQAGAAVRRCIANPPLSQVGSEILAIGEERGDWEDWDDDGEKPKKVQTGETRAQTRKPDRTGERCYWTQKPLGQPR